MIQLVTLQSSTDYQPYLVARLESGRVVVWNLLTFNRNLLPFQKTYSFWLVVWKQSLFATCLAVTPDKKIIIATSTFVKGVSSSPSPLS